MRIMCLTQSMWNEMVKHGRDDVEDFEDVSGTLCCPPPVLVHSSASEVKPRF